MTAAPPRTPAALVWFKRDLRLRDHHPLAEAARCEHALGLVIIEPAWLHSPECDPRHVAFLLDAVAALQQALHARGLPLLIRVGEAVQVLRDLRAQYPFSHLFSHEETGPAWSYARDRAVARWCKAEGIRWLQTPQTGVVRPLRSRNGWAATWERRMRAPQAEVPDGFRAPAGFVPEPVPRLAELGLAAPAIDLPRAGEQPAWACLSSFLSGRGRSYRQAISSPARAASACSRLSAHLAFGAISMRSVHQATEAHIARCADTDPDLALSLRAFSSRLRWHCHFMQKLEDAPEIEWRNLAQSMDGMRPGDGVHPDAMNQALFDAWAEGRTGFPMVDACMRQLRATGWLNFRMRAMLVSFAAYHLWLHWRAPGLFLARQFLDFEPGIHWCQMQMQSGTTGVNTLRIYSPAKQARDHDPLGHYIRRWVPEIGTPAYPQPIVDEAGALAHARERLYGIRSTAGARTEADAIQQRHGSRRAGLPATGRMRRARPAPPMVQGELF